MLILYPDILLYLLMVSVLTCWAPSVVRLGRGVFLTLPGPLSLGVCFSLQIECAAYNPEPQPPDPSAPARGFLWVSRLSVPTPRPTPSPRQWREVRMAQRGRRWPSASRRFSARRPGQGELLAVEGVPRHHHPPPETAPG